MTALSFSRVDAYLKCPWQFYHKFIAKDYPDEGDSIALIKGKELHSQLERWMKARLAEESTPDLNPIAKSAVPIMENVLTNYHSVVAEVQLAVNSKWEVVDWFADDTYYRAIIDLLAFKGDDEAIVIDWKSGKVRGYEAGKHTQLGLTAAMLFSIYPQLDTVKCYYQFLEHKKTSGVTFKREQLDSLKAPFVEIHAEINNTEFYTPKINDYCRYCKCRNSCELAK